MKANMKPESDAVKLSLEQTVLLWRLHRGGITDTALLRRITGITVHGKAMLGAVARFDRALAESFPLREFVRCRKCGGHVTSVPCVCCGPAAKNYVFTGRITHGPHG